MHFIPDFKWPLVYFASLKASLSKEHKIDGVAHMTQIKQQHSEAENVIKCYVLGHDDMKRGREREREPNVHHVQKFSLKIPRFERMLFSGFSFKFM